MDYVPRSERSWRGEIIIVGELLKKCVGSFKEGERIIVIGDLNTRIGDTTGDGVIKAYEVPRKKIQSVLWMYAKK